MSDTQPHVGDYWVRKSDGTRIQITRVWELSKDPGTGVAYDIHDGRPKLSSAMDLYLFLGAYEPETPRALAEDDVRRIVRQEVRATVALMRREVREEASALENSYDDTDRVRALDSLNVVLERVIRALEHQGAQHVDLAEQHT